MMSVLIKGMKMPKNCDKCPCCCDLGCAVKLITMTTKQMSENRPEWCPLVELPSKHGRLIDADALMDIFADRLAKVSVRYGIDSAVAGAVSGAMKLLDVQPIVIEAEGEE